MVRIDADHVVPASYLHDLIKKTRGGQPSRE
jgi:hypothetical protein